MFTIGWMSGWASRNWPPSHATRPSRFTLNPSGTTGVESRCSFFLSSVLPAYCCSSTRSEEHTSELQSLRHLVCRLLLEKKKKQNTLPHLKSLQGNGSCIEPLSERL